MAQLLVLILAGCGATDLPTSPPTLVETPEITPPVAPAVEPAPTPAAAPQNAAKACTPTDQDRYVYHPDRLAVQAACVRVAGTIAAIRREADGDLHILLALDGKFRAILRPANQGVELGDLVVEPVCVRTDGGADEPGEGANG